MRTYEPNPRSPAGQLRAMRCARPVLALCLGPLSHITAAQTPANLPQQMQQLEDAISRTQAQLEQSQRDLNELRNQLSALQNEIAHAEGKPAPSLPAQAAAE